MLRKEFLREKAVDLAFALTRLLNKKKKGHTQGDRGTVQRGESVKPARLTRTRNHSSRP